jgi:NAD(P)-dependent dehydrogenase (short-subunit alcohol dehydrogenase family)
MRRWAPGSARRAAGRCAAGSSRGHQLGGVHPDTIGAWERGEWTPGPQNLRILQRLLKLPDLGAELLAGRPAAAAPAAAEGLTVAGWAEVLARGWSAAMLLERLYEVDAEAFGGIDIVVGNVSALNIEDGEAAWEAEFRTDLMHSVRLVTTAMPWLEKSAHPSITFVLSLIHI